MMKLDLQRLVINSVFLLALSFLIIFGYVSYLQVKNLLNEKEWVNHTHVVIETSNEVLNDYTDLESRLYAYLISHDQSMVAGITNKLNTIDNNFNKIKQLTVDNLSQQKRLVILGAVLQKQLQLFKQTIQTYSVNPKPSLEHALSTTEMGQSDQIKRLFSEVKQAEESLLILRNQAFKSEENKANLISLMAIVFSAVLFLIFMILLNYFLNKRNFAEIKRKEAEDKILEMYQQLKINSERYELAIAGSNAGLWDWDINTDHVFYSSNLKHLLGYNESEFPPLFSSLESSLHPDEHDDVLAKIKKHLKDDLPFNMEFRLKHKDGGYLWFLAIAQSKFNEFKKPIRMVGSLIDITERKDNEEYRLRLAAIVESASDAIVSKNIDGIILSWNPAAEKLYGYSAEEAIGKSISMIIPEDGKKELNHILQTIKNGDALPCFETIRKHKNGLLIPVELVIAPIKNSTGKVIGASVIASDITERKKTDLLKNEFISMVSHELRTPLTSIQGSLALLASGSLGELSEKAQKILHIGKQNSERLIRLINDILDIEKIESGKMEFNLQPINIGTIVREAIDLNQAFAEKFDIKINLVQAVAPYVNVDRDRLMQVLTNLISNAVKFSFKKSDITLTITSEKNIVKVGVTNKGPGIPNGFRKKIFQKFSQATNVGPQSVAGAGLGLSISKEIIEKFNGTIGYTSEINKETTFYFELPILNQQLPITIIPKISTILVCEKDINYANYIKQTLEENNFKLFISHTAKDARKLLAEQSIDAMILDLDLPDQQGISFLKELRNSHSITDLPIIIISILTEQGKQKINANDISIIDWIEKPIEPSHLLHAIQALKMKIEGRTPNILHIEDDADLLHVISSLLQDEANICEVSTIQDAKAALKENKYDLVILDLMLPDGLGTELLPVISKTNTPTIVFSAYELSKSDSKYVVKNLLKSKVSAYEFVEAIKASLRIKELV